MYQPCQSAQGHGEHGSSNQFAVCFDEVPSLVDEGKSLDGADLDFCEAFDILTKKAE